MAGTRGRSSVLPGFGLTMGFTLTYLGLIVLIPLAALILKAATMTWAAFQETIASPRVLASLRLSFGASAVGAFANAVLGLPAAWVLVRYRFPGRRVVEAFVDLPFALPTAVAGITLTTIFAQTGWIGRYLEPLGIQTAYSPLGIVLALTFIGLPFVARTLQPVLEDLDPDIEEAAASLGASRRQTFTKAIFPTLLPAWITGIALAFARAVGEYGSVIFIAGNMPMRTEIAPLLIVTKLEQYDYAGATAVASVMLVISFAMLVGINLLQAWGGRR